MNSLDKLIDLAKDRGLLEDFQGVIDILETLSSDDMEELLNGLRVLIYHSPLKGYGDRFAHFCETYLYRTDMPFVSARVLVVLCSYMYPVEKFRGYIKQVLCGYEWDYDRDVQTSASGLAKDPFNATNDKDIICILIKTLKSGQDDKYHYTYEAILEIMGIQNNIPWKDWVEKDLKLLIDWDLVQRAAKYYCCE